jgi:hypothetical protein
MSTTGDETLVMTATFRAEATPILVVRDERERTLQYLCALVAWARTARVRRIVFAENSNTQFDFSEVVRLLEEAGKEVEVMVFDGNSETPRFGKGYGEGEILEYVYNRSRLLAATPVFYKVTGRLFVRNFDAVSEATTDTAAFPLNPPRDGRPRKAITSFFKCSRDLFETRLLSVYKQVSDEVGHRIEQVYYDQLVDLNVRGFRVKPVMVGQQGSTGKMYEPYDEDIVRTARSLLHA